MALMQFMNVWAGCAYIKHATNGRRRALVFFMGADAIKCAFVRRRA